MSNASARHCVAICAAAAAGMTPARASARASAASKSSMPCSRPAAEKTARIRSVAKRGSSSWLVVPAPTTDRCRSDVEEHRVLRSLEDHVPLQCALARRELLRNQGRTALGGNELEYRIVGVRRLVGEADP